MRSTIGVGAIIALFLLGCASDMHPEPARPTALGTLQVADTVDTSAFTTLELSFEPIGPDMWGEGDRQSMPLDSLSFPLDYQVGGGLGWSSAVEWRVVAWLSSDPEPSAEPLAGEPSAEATLDYSCEVRGEEVRGCGFRYGVDLEIP